MAGGFVLSDYILKHDPITALIFRFLLYAAISEFLVQDSSRIWLDWIRRKERRLKRTEQWTKIRFPKYFDLMIGKAYLGKTSSECTLVKSQNGFYCKCWKKRSVNNRQTLNEHWERSCTERLKTAFHTEWLLVQWVEQLLLTPEIHGLNPVIGNFYFLSTDIKK